MRVLTIPSDLAKEYLYARDSYDTAFQAVMVALPDFPVEERRDFYVNAFNDLCNHAAIIANIEKDIMEALNISSFERIEVDKVYTMEDEYDN